MSWLAKLWDRYRRTPKALRWLAWPVVVLLAAYVIEDWRGRREESALTAKWLAAGLPLQWDDVRALYPPPAPEDDFLSAPIVAEFLQAPDPKKTRLSDAVAFSGRLTVTPRKGANFHPYADGVVPPVPVDPSDSVKRGEEDQARHLLTLFAPQSSALDELAEAVKRPSRRFGNPKEGMPHLLENLDDFPLQIPLVTASHLYFSRARAHLCLGHRQEALDNLLTLLRMARLQGHPSNFLLGQLSSNVSASRACHVVWEGLHRGAWDEAQLAELEDALAELQPAANYPAVLQTECALGDWLMQTPEGRRLGVKYAFLGDAEGPETGFLSGVLDRAVPDGVLCQMGLVTWRPIVEEVLLPGGVRSLELQKGHLDRWEARRFASPSTVYEFLGKRNFDLFNAHSMGTSALSIQQSLDLARIAVALERWCLEKGSYPAALADLAPRYLASIPEDRFVAGRPLSYRVPSTQVYIIYSCGPDGVDDGGVPPAKHKPNGDAVWRNRP